MYIKIIWIIFTLVFSYLAWKTWRESQKNIKLFEIPERSSNFPKGMSFSVKIAGDDIDGPLKRFVESLNDYIMDVNKTNQRANVIASVGYASAALTSLVSLFLLIIKQ